MQPVWLRIVGIMAASDFPVHKYNKGTCFLFKNKGSEIPPGGEVQMWMECSLVRVAWRVSFRVAEGILVFCMKIWTLQISESVSPKTMTQSRRFLMRDVQEPCGLKLSLSGYALYNTSIW
jgi:hypothetical protein